MATIMLFVSAETNEILKSDIEECLESMSKKYKIETALVKAFAQVESEYKYAALRYEPHLRKATWYTNNLDAKTLNDRYAYCSMGVMQIMYATAKSLGFKGTPFSLMEPRNSIEYGCKHIALLIKRYYHLDKVISSYNQGSPRRTRRADGEMVFRNQAYVDKVLDAYRSLGGVH